MRSIFISWCLLLGRVRTVSSARTLALVNEGRSGGDGLQHLLSPGASIFQGIASAPRWSEFDEPQPGIVVNVATERDVQATVQWCLRNGRPFMAQTGGHGWQDTFNLDQNGVLINLRGLNSTVVSRDKKTARVGGGTIVQEVIDAAYASDVQILTGNCNCVGTLGAALGGGYGNLLGIYGFSVDNILALDVVLATGELVTVTPFQSDLWWALRGAGPNFGIVTSAVYEAYATPAAQNTAWLGSLVYTQDKLEQVVQAIEDIKLEPHMVVFLYLATDGPPSFTPSVIVTPFFLGSEADARTAFKAFLDIGPVADTTAVLPYNQWNAGADGFCVKGGRKPGYAIGLDHMVPATWRQVWDAYTAFAAIPGNGYSAVLVECYSLIKAQTDASYASFANRDIRFNSAVLPWYYDASFDPQAEAFGSSTRDLLRATAGVPQNRSYINFAHGDESAQQVYGSSTDRLRWLKRRYDPHNVFNHWFDLS